MEVNDPVPSTLGSWSLPCPGFGSVPPLWSSKEATKTVLTAWLWPRTKLKGVKHGFTKKGLLWGATFISTKTEHTWIRDSEAFWPEMWEGWHMEGWLKWIWITVDSIGVACSLALLPQLNSVPPGSKPSSQLQFFSCNFLNGLNISAIALDLL